MLLPPFCIKLEHMSDQLIRASEIAEYVYCHRAWWLRRAGAMVETAASLALSQFPRRLLLAPSATVD